MTTTESTTTDRQPCKCGKRPLLTAIEDKGHAMSCTCGAWGPVLPTPAEALAAWNAGTRSTSPLIAEMDVQTAIDVLQAYTAGALQTDLCDEFDAALEAAYEAWLKDHEEPGDYETPLSSSW